MARENHAWRIVRDLVKFALANKKWWILPVVFVCLLLVGLVVVANSPVAPFVYTVF